MIFAISGTDLDEEDIAWTERVAAQRFVRPAPGTWLAHRGGSGLPLSTLHEAPNVVVIAEARTAGSPERSDATAIARAYEQHELDLMPHVPGSVAFVLFDVSRQRLLASSTLTSRLPLAYWSDGRRTLVSSRLLGLLRHARAPRAVDEQYLASTVLSSTTTPAGCTPIAGVRRLRGGEALLVSNGTTRVTSIDGLRPHRPPAPGLEALTMWERLQESVSNVTRPGAKPCLALSGGLDSVSVAAAAGGRRSIAAFSMLAPSYTVKGEPIDEGAALTALEREWPPLRIERIDCSTCNVYPDLGGFELRDDPPLTPLSLVASRLRTWESMRAGGFESVLDGEGGDELFSLYVTPLDALRSGHWLALLAHLRSAGGRRLLIERSLLLPLLPGIVREAWARRGARSGSILPAYLAPAALARSELAEACEAHFGQLAHRPAAERFAQWLSSPWSVGSALAHDTLASRFGLALVSPMLDRNFVECVLGLPASSMLPRREDKRLLRRALAGRIPEAVRRLAKDTRLPEKFFLDVVVSEPVRDALATERVRARLADWVRVPKLEGLIEAIRRGYRPHRWLTWQLESVVSFAEWYARASQEYGVD